MIDDDGRMIIKMNNNTMRCLTVVVVALIVSMFGSCLYHCESQADRRFRCIELMHDVETCSGAFGGNK